MSYLWNFFSGNVVLDQLSPLFLHLELFVFVKQNNLLYLAGKFQKRRWSDGGYTHWTNAKAMFPIMWAVHDLTSAILIGG